MKPEASQTLSLALDRLKVVDLWERFDPSSCPHRSEGVFSSPWPGEHQHSDRNHSFSILPGGQSWKNHASGEAGSIWKFAQKCWPSMPKGDMAKYLIELAGLDPGPSAGPSRLTPKQINRRQRTIRESAKKRFYEERQNALTPPAFPDSIVPPWPDFIRERFEDGAAFLEGSEKRVKSTADDRGWNPQWVAALVDQGLFACPWFPWSQPGRKWAGRGKAFLVQCPKQVAGDPGNLNLHPVGYHQRFWRKQTNSKSWMYVPSIPRSNKLRLPFVHQLAEHGQSIPGLPFVLGDLDHPDLIVISEGQWDAITFFGACGWLDSDTAFPGGVACFGLRGVQGSELFLKWYGAWIAAIKPCAIVLADNDAPGRQLFEPKPNSNGPSAPTFCKRLKAFGCSRVVSYFPKIEGVKDFNDLFKLKKFTPANMEKFIQKSMEQTAETIPI